MGCHSIGNQFWSHLTLWIRVLIGSFARLLLGSGISCESTQRGFFHQHFAPPSDHSAATKAELPKKKKAMHPAIRVITRLSWGRATLSSPASCLGIQTINLGVLFWGSFFLLCFKPLWWNTRLYLWVRADSKVGLTQTETSNWKHRKL